MKLKAIRIMLSMIPSIARGVGAGDVEKIKAICRETFPSAKQLPTRKLAQWLEEPDHSILLIDVRSPEEFAVSHLRGAVNLRNVTGIARAVSERRPARTVLYCSVGFRSSRLAWKLRSLAAGEVLNLEGSIFEWANEGRPLYRVEAEVHKVHPFGRRWAGLLNPGLASDCG